MKLLSNIKNTSFNFLNRKKLASKDTTTKASRQSKHELDVKVKKGIGSNNKTPAWLRDLFSAAAMATVGASTLVNMPISEAQQNSTPPQLRQANVENVRAKNMKLASAIPAVPTFVKAQPKVMGALADIGIGGSGLLTSVGLIGSAANKVKNGEFFD